MALTSGVGRAQSLVDVLRSMNDQSQAPIDQTVQGLGQLAQADEQITVADQVTTTVLATPGWDNGTWGATTWS
ncbi:hypothetical protein ORV05_05010 [Amycolatopsis cynarae]|uniref:Uncharacterized protein n=1 Tax=Amycolatopsis cynarae TaxID=2995223 RepID=A0ABY7B5C6_9PSEU|nr:hypothetical protein [Amycolatopsis sp. HUAS 11-8]WAL67152.1 hypothetical protein ORV05_05010 [Amycolatopsis sp. HUAS 11-8]